MKLQYMCLDSALDLWPLGQFELGFFASWSFFFVNGQLTSDALGN